MAGIGIAKRGLGLLGKKLRKEPWVKAELKRGTHPGWIKDRAKQRAENVADRILKKKNIERIRQLPESIGGKGIKDFGRGRK